MRGKGMSGNVMSWGAVRLVGFYPQEGEAALRPVCRVGASLQIEYVGLG
jgi:hypothetical protein